MGKAPGRFHAIKGIPIVISLKAIRRFAGSLVKPRPHQIKFGGGWDQIMPPMELPSGFVRSSQNWECDVIGGYVRAKGYERFDGRTSPSAGVYSIIGITLTGAISVGDTVTGVTSTATAKVIAVPGATSIVVTKIAIDTFESGEVLNVSGSPQATTTSVAIPSSGSTVLLHAQYKNLAADSYRADIAAATGIGNSLGGVRFGGVTYTFRNNVDTVTADLWKSTASGWSKITLYNEISFTLGGATLPADATTLTQGSVTATIKRVVTTTPFNTWGLNTAAGRFIITNPAGGTTHFVAGAATIGSINVTLSGAETAITLLKNGRYKCHVANFAGGSSTERIYGCDGVNRGFEFDGTIFVPIHTGMTSDIPTRVYAHKNHLFFAFGSSVQHSGPGTPYIWSVILGAEEIGMGDSVTGFMVQAGGIGGAASLAIFTRNRTSMLYGTGRTDWQLTPYRERMGAYPDTIQDAGRTMFLDDPGVTTLQAAQEFGNFAHNTVSERVRTWLNGQRTKAVDSCVVRDKSQYRLFFSDGYALYVTFSGDKVVGVMPILFPKIPTWVYASEESDGSETIFFGATDGMVYQMEKGTSFDGAAISHLLYTAWDFLGSPRTIKRFYDCTVEISGVGYASVYFNYELGYHSVDIAQQVKATNFALGTWDDPSGVWDVGIWDGATVSPSTFDMSGEAENVSLYFGGSSDYEESFKLSGAIIHSAPRRELR